MTKKDAKGVFMHYLITIILPLTKMLFYTGYLFLVEVGLRAQNVIWNFRAPSGIIQWAGGLKSKFKILQVEYMH
jgi:hypothetical protein